jgi:hypothetical protein
VSQEVNIPRVTGRAGATARTATALEVDGLESARALPPSHWDHRERIGVEGTGPLGDGSARRRVSRRLTALVMEDISMILSSVDVLRGRVDAVTQTRQGRIVFVPARCGYVVRPTRRSAASFHRGSHSLADRPSIRVSRDRAHALTGIPPRIYCRDRLSSPELGASRRPPPTSSVRLVVDHGAAASFGVRLPDTPPNDSLRT